ncbi:MAG: hypothetical protein EXR69_02380 [Myxococcales bacterium]|nr:hypothetical protein [Myxococcales bacterium]
MLLLCVGLAASSAPTVAAEPLTSTQAAELYGDASIAALEALRPALLVLLDEVAHATPDHVRVTRLHVSGPVLRIEGLGGDPAERQAFTKALCADGRIVQCGLESRLHIDPFAIHALVTVPRSASASPGGFDARRVLGSPATELSRTAALKTARDAADAQGATGLVFDIRPDRRVGAVDLLPIQVTGYCRFHDLAVLMDLLQRSPEPSYWSALELTMGVPPAGLVGHGLARAQSASRLGWPLDDVAVAVRGELLWPTPALDPGGAVAPPGVAWPSGPALTTAWSYNPAGLRDPFRDLQLWHPAPAVIAAPAPLEPGEFVVAGVRAEDALKLAARAAGLVVRWSGPAEPWKDARVTASGAGSLRAFCTAMLKSVGLAATPTKTELQVRKTAKAKLPPAPADKSGGQSTISLDSVDLDALWLVGLANGQRPSALLVDDHDHPFLVHVGSHLLDRKGKVTAILSDRIVVSFTDGRSPIDIALYSED